MQTQFQSSLHLTLLSWFFFFTTATLVNPSQHMCPLKTWVSTALCTTPCSSCLWMWRAARGKKAFRGAIETGGVPERGSQYPEPRVHRTDRRRTLNSYGGGGAALKICHWRTKRQSRTPTLHLIFHHRRTWVWKSWSCGFNCQHSNVLFHVDIILMKYMVHSHNRALPCGCSVESWWVGEVIESYESITSSCVRVSV